MLLQDAIKKRRAVKHFIPEGPIDDALFNELMEAVILSPTSYNMQNWRFVRVTDNQLRDDITLAAWGQSQVSMAAELIILCADLNAWQTQPMRYFENAPLAIAEAQVSMMRDFYINKPSVQRDEAMRSCGIAAQTLMLKAKSLGLDTCPMVGFDPQKVAKLIQLPDSHVITMMVALGRAEQPAHQRGGQLPLNEVLIENQFG